MVRLRSRLGSLPTRQQSLCDPKLTVRKVNGIAALSQPELRQRACGNVVNNLLSPIPTRTPK